MIPYARQEIDAADIQAVVRVLQSDWLTQGPDISRFEQVMAERVGAAGAVAVNSATSALHLACRALDVGPGDLGWTSANTFVASANCLLYCGAEVDFVDIDPETQNLSLHALEKKLEMAAIAGRLPKVLIPVHFAGRSCDMAGIGRLASRYGFHVIEDASHAVGADNAGIPVGACAHSDVTVFSFHPVKILTTGEGGMALGQDAALLRRISRLRSHGITREAAEMEGVVEGAWQYQQIELGYNYRMTDLQAALGESQARRLDEFLRQRRLLARRYRELLAHLPLDLPPTSEESAWHLYVVRLRDSSRRREVFDALRAAGIGVNVHYQPVYLQPWYRRLGFQPGHCPNAEAYYAACISLPLWPGLTRAEQDRVVEELAGALESA